MAAATVEATYKEFGRELRYFKFLAISFEKLFLEVAPPGIAELPLLHEPGGENACAQPSPDSFGDVRKQAYAEFARELRYLKYLVAGVEQLWLQYSPLGARQLPMLPEGEEAASLATMRAQRLTCDGRAASRAEPELLPGLSARASPAAPLASALAGLPPPPAAGATLPSSGLASALATSGLPGEGLAAASNAARGGAQRPPPGTANNAIRETIEATMPMPRLAVRREPGSTSV
mmetsp:Transcript_66831/g.185081  ORF Transcript_66831/g.185081 Transcript_66831/m.185081 type:complete len:234 (+) Transcript_66831:216-917(+)